jgi:hypothetical protein
MGWTVLPHPAHSPDLAPSNYHQFGPVKDALFGCHFANDNELKQTFCEVLRSQGRDFYSSDIQCLTQHWQKCVEKDGDFVEKYPHSHKICMNHHCKFHCYCNYIFLKEVRGITFIPHFVCLYFLMFLNCRKVWFEVLTAVSINVFWFVVLYRLVWVYQRFRGVYCLHYQDTSPFVQKFDISSYCFFFFVGAFVEWMPLLELWNNTHSLKCFYHLK